MKILIAGSSGFIGSALVTYFTAQGHDVKRLVRPSQKDYAGPVIFWDPDHEALNPSELEGFDAVINLAGENIVNTRWTEEKKERIFKSRVNSTALLSQTLAQLQSPPKVFINSSAIGYYGNRWDITQTEESMRGVGFLANLCTHWEAATEPAEARSIRVVKLRTGVVLSPKGGALSKMLPPFQWGVGGKLGGGAQYLSWITLEDLLRLIDFILTNEAISGPVNAVTPHPVTNEELTKTLGKILGRPTFFHMPELMVKLIFGEVADEMLLSSTKAVPEKLMRVGFEFHYPELEGALRHLLKNE